MRPARARCRSSSRRGRARTPFAGSAYEYHRDRGLNTNYYFNEVNGLGKNVLTLNQWGFREGGPIVIPGMYDGRGKAFFFFNFEQLRFPLSNTRTRLMLSPSAQSGVFQYTVAGGFQSINLYTVAAANGQTSTPDPTVAALLTKIRTGASTTGKINDRTDPNTQDYLWQPESLRTRQLTRRTRRLQPVGAATV